MHHRWKVISAAQQVLVGDYGRIFCAVNRLDADLAGNPTRYVLTGPEFEEGEVATLGDARAAGEAHLDAAPPPPR
jgi:hypothetical protein